MADNPWAVVPTTETTEAPDNPWAVVPEVSTAKDVAKTAAPSLLRGVIGALTMPGTLSDLVGKGAEWALNKIAPDSKLAGAVKALREIDTDPKTGKSISDQHSFFPSYDTVKDKAEKVTGPLYDATTPVGKGVQTGLEVVPNLLGGSVAGTAAKAIGAGTGSALLGEGAKAAGDMLPAWVEPAARAAGAMVGTGLPAAARRVRTPLPMTDERLATVNALKAKNPELVDAASAGQLTGSPRVMSLEGRAPNMAGLPEKQAEAYTQGVMRQAGSNGMFDTAGLAEAKKTGAQLDTLRNAHQMSPSEFALLKQDINAMGRPGSELYRAVGPSKAFKEVQDAVRLGPSGGNPPPLNMTGQRYGALKQILQSAGEGAPTSHEQTAIFNARDRLNKAFHDSMPQAEAERLRLLDQKYSNYKTIENIGTTPNQNTISPKEVFNKAPRGSQLEEHATQAASVMKPLPKPNNEGGVITKTLGGVLPLAGDTLFHGGLTLGAEAPFMSYYGYNHLGDYVNALKTGAGKIVSRPGVQDYLKNQKWRPDAYTSAPDREQLLRLLMAPPEVQSLPGQSR